MSILVTPLIIFLTHNLQIRLKNKNIWTACRNGVDHFVLDHLHFPLLINIGQEGIDDTVISVLQRYP